MNTAECAIRPYPLDVYISDLRRKANPRGIRRVLGPSERTSASILIQQRQQLTMCTRIRRWLLLLTRRGRGGPLGPSSSLTTAAASVTAPRTAASWRTHG